jgi:hypothetical protein
MAWYDALGDAAGVEEGGEGTPKGSANGAIFCVTVELSRLFDAGCVTRHAGS